LELEKHKKAKSDLRCGLQIFCVVNMRYHFFRLNSRQWFVPTSNGIGYAAPTTNQDSPVLFRWVAGLWDGVYDCSRGAEAGGTRKFLLLIFLYRLNWKSNYFSLMTLIEGASEVTQRM
jgi:hypothetical protein